jgi:hypothetical protein
MPCSYWASGSFCVQWLILGLSSDPASYFPIL